MTLKKFFIAVLYLLSLVSFAQKNHKGKLVVNAILLPLDINCGEYEYNGIKLPALNASASQAAGGSMINIDLKKAIDIDVDVRGAKSKKMKARILTSDKVGDFNSFDNPTIVKPAEFKGVKMNNGTITGKIPSKTVVVIEIK